MRPRGHRIGGAQLNLVHPRAGRVADGKPHLIVVLDTDGDGLAAEAARAVAGDAFAVEFMDVAAWRAMRRLAAAGLEARELHRARGLPDESPAAASGTPREAEAIAETDRALPSEAMALLEEMQSLSPAYAIEIPQGGGPSGLPDSADPGER